MSDFIIKAENLGKKYVIGHQTANRRYVALRDVVAQNVRALWRMTKDMAQGKPIIMGNEFEEVWALKDVNFEIQRGEVVGIIGRNGAGKSTLLKVLSRITEPSTGRVTIKGRVASLLEVGTGFHPELTGRENIYLNGAILGMTRAEVKRKFDEIVAFAEVEKFLDTPVKRYSSGMYVRLAFAVAAHLEPEILVVDEVLAVGDAAFQKKCLGKMEEVGSEGRTVLFVSHSMPMILRLCKRVLLLESGEKLADASAEEVIGVYLSTDGGSSSERVWSSLKTAPGDSAVRLRTVRVHDGEGKIADAIDIRKPIYLEMEYWNLQGHLYPTAILHVINEEGITLFSTNDFNNSEWAKTPRAPGMVRATCVIPGNFLAEGRFFVLAAIATYNPNVVHALERDAVSFQVVDRSEGDGVRGGYVGGRWPGVIRPMLQWNVVAEPGEVFNE